MSAEQVLRAAIVKQLEGFSNERGLWPGASLIKKKLFTMTFLTMPGTALIAPRRP